MPEISEEKKEQILSGFGETQKKRNKKIAVYVTLGVLLCFFVITSILSCVLFAQINSNKYHLEFRIRYNWKEDVRVGYKFISNNEGEYYCRQTIYNQETKEYEYLPTTQKFRYVYIDESKSSIMCDFYAVEGPEGARITKTTILLMVSKYYLMESNGNIFTSEKYITNK